MICKKIFDGDDKFADFKTNFESCYTSLKCKVEDIKKESDKAKKDLATNNN